MTAKGLQWSAQQLAKMFGPPGDAVSGAIAAAGTKGIGEAAIAYYFSGDPPRRTAEREAEQVENATIDHVCIGEDDSEKDHAIESENSKRGEAPAPYTHWRDATGWFSYEMKCLPGDPMQLHVTYLGSDGGDRRFDILVDGMHVATEQLKPRLADKFYTNVYEIPRGLTRGKEKIRVRFQPKPHNVAGGIMDLRLTRALSSETPKSTLTGKVTAYFRNALGRSGEASTGHGTV